MPFGLKNSPSTWMRFVTTVLGDLGFVFAYFDDILIFSDDLEQHLEHLEIIFQRLDKYGLTINNVKSKFCKSDVEFLGFQISQQGIQPTEQRTQYFRDLKKPNTVMALRKVLGIFFVLLTICKRCSRTYGTFVRRSKRKNKETR